MKKHFLLFLLLAACVSSSAHAGLISGTHKLANGNSVALQGLEWMPLIYTAGLSRTDVEDGFTDAFGGVWGATDWRYATRLETAMLLGSLWDQRHDGWSNENYLGAKWFLDTFGELNTQQDSWAFTGLGSSSFAYGNAGECSKNLSLTCEGLVMAMLASGLSTNSADLHTGNGVNSDQTRPNGKFGLDYGLDATPWATPRTTLSSAHWRSLGSLLVRNPQQVESPIVSSVPEPSVLSLLALGLGGLLFRRRKASQ